MRDIPRLHVVVFWIVFTEEEVLNDNDGYVGGCPVTDDTQEVDQCTVELVCPDDGDGYNAERRVK